MALDPNYLQSLPQSLVDMYGLVEIDILTDMARRINTYDFFIPAAQHQNQKLQELGRTQEEIVVRLAALTGRTQEEIVELLTEAGEVAIEDDVEYYKTAEVYEPKKVNTEALYAQLNAGLLQTQQAFFNITGTTANTATKQFERALDRAWTQINTGGMDYNTAIRRAIEGLSDAGIGAVEYPSGRIDTLETAVRRAVVTGANQTAIKTQEVLADELEIDLVETTAHGGARPDHAKWQGQVFSRNGRKTIDGVTYEDLRKATGYGKAGGLCGVNCRHSFHPYVPGTARTWSEKELEALEEKKVEYNGKKLTEYEANQVQRGTEREIRKLKRKAAALEAAGLDASEVQKDLREANKIYNDFTKQTGIRKQPDRLKVAKGTDITGPSGNAPQTPATTPDGSAPGSQRQLMQQEADEQMEQEARQTVKDSRVVAEGKDLVGEWQPSGEYEHVISDVVHAQHYDNLPEVVEYDDFKKAMTKANFYAERTYTADSMETLEEYRDMLYNGKWYIDCSTGGAQYGQGMYCAACYDLKDNKSLGGIGWEMAHYQEIGKANGRNYSFTEAITLQPDAKILKLPNGKKADEYISDVYQRNYLRKNAPVEKQPLVEQYIKACEVCDNLTFREDNNYIDEVYEKRNSLYDEVKGYMKGSMQAMQYKTGDMKYPKFKDPGVLAVEMGYDAINAEGHGESGSYTVILNRSKVIICKGGSIYGN